MALPFAKPTDLVPSDDDLIDYATALIRLSCEWHIYPVESATFGVDIYGVCPRPSFFGRSGRLYLPTLQLVSVTSATLPDGAVLVTDQLSFDPAGWVERVDGQPWPSFGRVQFAVTHGYGEVPPAVKAATVSIAKRMPAALSVWTHRKMGTAVVQMAPTVSIPPGAFTVAEDLVLERFRLPVTRA